MWHIFNPFKREREEAELAAMKAQIKAWLRVYLAIFILLCVVAFVGIAYCAGFTQGSGINLRPTACRRV